MRKDSGFTLIELMVTVSVLAILLGIGVPSMIEFVNSNRRAAAVNALVTDLHRARTAAASTGRNVLICHSIDGGNCSGDAAPDWAEGWIVFVDDNMDSVDEAGDNNGAVDAGEPMLSVSPPRNGIRMRGNRGLFRYTSDFSLSGQAGSINVCPPQPTRGRAISVGITGRPSLEDLDPSACP